MWTRFLLLLSVAVSASAQPVQPSAAAIPVRIVVIDHAEFDASAQRTRLSPAGASLLSVGATALLIGGALATRQPEGTDGRTALLVVTGALVGPSVGNLAVGNLSGALKGTGLRVLGGGIGLLGLGSAFMHDGSLVIPGALVIAGAAVALGGVVYDVVSAGRHVSRLRVTPSADLGTRSPSLHVALTFGSRRR